MRPADSHLTPHELDLVLFSGAGSNLTTADRAQAQEAQLHLERCEYCRSVAKQYSRIELTLGRLRSGPTSVRTKDCPDEALWVELAAGLVDESRSSKLTEHAAHCDYCGNRLREVAEDLTAQPSEEVEAAVAALATVQPDRQRALAARLAKTPASIEEKGRSQVRQWKPEQEKHRFRWWPRLVWAAAGVAVLVVAVLLGMRMFRQPDPNELLAKAYTQKRTIELRFPRAEYGPIRVERGAGNKDQPTEFYEAEVIIKRESAKHAEDPNWLQARAQAELLQWDYESAIRNIEDALMLKPDDPALLQTKAMAYFERAEKLGLEGAIDYGEAAEDLSKALKKSPDDAVALFNRAIIYDKIHLPNEAIQDLEHYLKLDPSGQWSAEAKERLDRLKKMVKAHDDALAEPLADPASFLRLMGDPTAVAHVDERIEDYQDLAIRGWLPAAFPLSGRNSKSAEAFSALRALAEVLHERHKDKWLNDLLDESSNSPEFAKAVNELSEAEKRSSAGEPSGALRAALHAAELFGKAGDQSGVLRAEVERVHALQRSQLGDRCLRAAAQIAASLGEYHWLRSQLLIDECACSIMIGSFPRARSYISDSLGEAASTRYRALHLRALGIAAAVETDEGNLNGAAEKDVEGLSAYWTWLSAPPMRAHQFYDDLDYVIEDLKLWNLATSIGKESIATILQTDDRSAEALNRAHVARLELAAGNIGSAELQLNHALHLFEILPQTEAIRAYRLYAEIDVARMDISKGDVAAAEAKLNAVGETLQATKSFEIPLFFYSTEGMLYLSKSDNSRAEIALRQAEKIAESNVQGLDTDSAHYWADETSSVFRDLVFAQIRLQDAESALKTWEIYRFFALGGGAAAQRALRVNSFEQTLQSVTKSLGGNTFLSYSLLRNGIGVFLVDDEGVHSSFVDADPQQVAALVAHFAKMCSDPDSNRALLQRIGRQLFDLLIGRLNRKLKGSELFVELDDALGDFPFQALVAPDGKFLVQHYRVMFSPGLLYRTASRPVATISDASYLVALGSAAIGDGQADIPLPDTGREAKEVAARFRNGKLLLGREASVASLEQFLPKAEVVHIAAHSASTSNHEGLLLLSGSAQGDTTIWDSQRIKPSLLRHAQLVVLSACATGRSAALRNETRGTLVRAILAAGVPQLVVTRWDIDSAATRRFMGRFYSELLSGEPVLEAFQRAQVALLNERSMNHPYSWAGIALFGND